VTSASQIPCLDSLPEGWSISAVQVDQNGTVVTLDSDRAGNAAATLNLQPTCDLSGSVSSPSDLEGGERYDRIDQLEPSFKATRFYVFPGGCLWWEFDFRKGASATESVAIGEVLYLVPRDEVNAELRKHFIDADL